MSEQEIDAERQFRREARINFPDMTELLLDMIRYNLVDYVADDKTGQVIFNFPDQVLNKIKIEDDGV